MTSQQPDLSALTRERPSEGRPAPRHRSRWLSRYVVPLGIVVGFLGLLAAVAGEQLLPRTPVTVVPVLVTRQQVQREGTPLFDAAGWVEPRPTPIKVAALTEGVVDVLRVVEGQPVAAGEVVAELIDVDARLALGRARSQRQLRDAELLQAQSELEAARRRHAHPVHLDAPLAAARAELARTETAIGELPFLITAAEARLEFAEQQRTGLTASRGAIAERRIQEAESSVRETSATLQELQQRRPRLEQQAQAEAERVQALTQQRQLLIEETRQLDEATARCRIAEARLEDAKLAVEAAELELERTKIRAPVDGRVLSLIAWPGTRVTGGTSATHTDAGTVITLYDPARLQVRADVRLEDVPMVTAGQRVKIATAASRDPILGQVLLPTSSANIQKNTLEVKVALDDPPPAIRPEMLVTATFLAPPTPDADGSLTERTERLLIPGRLVQETGGTTTVWIVDAGGRAQRRSVTTGARGSDGLVEVTRGLQPTDRLIVAGRESLQPGHRVVVTGEDATIGMDPSA